MSAGTQPRLLLQVSLTSELSAVRLAAARMGSALAAQGIGAEARAEIELCVVEAMNNVVEHGYGLCAGQPFELSLWWSEHGLVIELRDEGRPIPEGMLDQASLPEVGDGDIQDLPDRGWGLGLLRELMDEVHYESRQGGNLLRLVRRRLTDSSSLPR